MIHILRYTEELEKVGFTNEQAKKSVQLWMDLMDQNFATKADFKEHYFMTKTDLKEVQNEMKVLKTDLQSEMKDLKTKSVLYSVSILIKKGYIRRAQGLHRGNKSLAFVQLRTV